MFIPVFGRNWQINHLLGKLNEFHVCATRPIQIGVGGHWKNFTQMLR